jgi:hypothetical protein
MTKISYLPHVPEPAPPPSAVSQWSFGIAMFAAFVLPFVLLVTSARYRLFADQAVLMLRSSAQESLRINASNPGPIQTPSQQHP